MNWWLVITPYETRNHFVYANSKADVEEIVEKVFICTKDEISFIEAIETEVPKMKKDASLYGQGIYLYYHKDMIYKPVNLRNHFLDEHCKNLFE